MTVHIFAGPTIDTPGIRRILPDAACHPPAQHGDLLRLSLAATDQVLIIDGLWHQVAPLRHKELLHALAAGVTVVGAASMGALRAAELAPYGMVGIGQVFDAFASGALDADDEVAVLHTPEGHKVTEALVNIRCAIDRAASSGKVSNSDAAALVDLARSLPYTRRSWPALGRAAQQADLESAFYAANTWRQANPYDLKREDAESALTLLSQGLPSPTTGARWRGERWQTSFVRYWTASFQPGAGRIPMLAQLQHQQLYDGGFAARWRAKVLAAISGSPTGLPPEVVEKAALDTARQAGTTLANLSLAQRAHWLAPAEEQLEPNEAMLRIMVRSARLDGAWNVWPATHAEAARLLDPAIGTAQLVKDAFLVNDSAQADNPRHTPTHLDSGRITAHLLSHWGLSADADQAARDAAARDRAFRDFAGAVEVARAFYLGARVAEANAVSAASSSSVADSSRT
ncbi:TfuA-like protein [Streptomyces sp. NBC_00853]|uniref:TfuA-like protein n=1 Tax=Streptomyces sp. NBC_00853 TaxID=2903681 RepID=UPI003873629F|nr:TfuA-like protein [Streptomyces sp. NBC_00853]